MREGHYSRTPVLLTANLGLSRQSTPVVLLYAAQTTGTHPRSQQRSYSRRETKRKIAVVADRTDDSCGQTATALLPLITEEHELCPRTRSTKLSPSRGRRKNSTWYSYLPYSNWNVPSRCCGCPPAHVVGHTASYPRSMRTQRAVMMTRVGGGKVYTVGTDDSTV